MTLGAIFAGQMRSLAEYLSVPITMGTATCIAMLLYFILRRIQNWPMLAIAPVMLSAVMASAGLQTSADYGSHMLFHQVSADHVMPDTSPKSIVVVWSIYLALYMCNAALLGLTFLAHRARNQEIALAFAERDLARAETLKTEAQLKMLRLQLDPHFMVNSLGTIAALTLTDRRDEAVGMADRLAEFLQLSLETSDGAEQTLGEEIAVTEAYLNVEAIRFEDRLEIEISCPEALEDVPVPNFILQPLVENAMKYGVGPSAGAVRLTVSAQEDGENLRLVVEDSASGRTQSAPAKSMGIGLTNTRNRLAAHYGDRASLVTHATATGFRSELLIPLQRETASVGSAKTSLPPLAFAESMR